MPGQRVGCIVPSTSRESRVYFWGHIRLMEKKMETTIEGFGFWVYSPPEVDRIWGIWGSYHTLPKAIFYLLKGDYRVWGFRVSGSWFAS